jgi:hypothetical protein
MPQTFLLNGQCNTTKKPGTDSNLAVQLQAVIAGPDSQGQAYVVLVNYSQDQSSGGFVTQIYGPQTVT